LHQHYHDATPLSSKMPDPTASSRATPHVRLNSSQDNILNRPHPTPAQGRSLTAPRPPPIGISIQPQPQFKRLQQRGGFDSPSIPGSGRTSPSLSVVDPDERLLPPSGLGRGRFRDYDSPRSSPSQSGFSSRRSSVGSNASGYGDRNYSPNPFADSRAPSRSGSDEEEYVTTQTVAQRYNILPSEGLLLFPEEVEKDDYLHNPDPNDKMRDCDIWNRRGLVNLGGLMIMTLGVLMVFIGYPVLTFVRNKLDPPNRCAGNPDCIAKSAYTKTSADGKTLNLVFSDEFSKPGRTFYPGDDPYWTAVDLWYGVTQDLEWYDPDAVTTKNGALEIRMDAFQSHGLNYRSGMLQSWNQMCFQGGHLEASVSLPGTGDTVGFWPGFWAMGNLGRPGYAATTEGLWPYSYDDICDAGSTKNQSSTDGISMLPGLRLPACSCVGEDHPSPGRSRSAPEIDVFEASVGNLDATGNMVGVVSQSAQFAPFDIFYEPDYGFVELADPTLTAMNTYRGGPYQQTISGVTNLNNEWYDGNAYQTYAIEYVPGSSGNVRWFVGAEQTWKMDARAVRPNGNVGQRVIPVEPMALIMNLGISDSFAILNWTGMGSVLPVTMRFDYVRIYQDSGAESVTCDPPGMATTGYIQNHQDAYFNPNKTQW
jgi:beta-glucanase (GH16 family)